LSQKYITIFYFDGVFIELFKVPLKVGNLNNTNGSKKLVLNENIGEILGGTQCQMGDSIMLSEC